MSNHEIHENHEKVRQFAEVQSGILLVLQRLVG